MCNNDLVLSIKDASGRHVSLLNENTPANYKMNSLNSANTTITVRRKYHCTEPGCNKSFTTRYDENNLSKLTFINVVF